MAVRKRKRGNRVTWLADYFDQQGKRHNKTFATQKAAKDWLAQTIVDVKKGIHTPTTSAATTVAEAGEEWVAEAEIDGLERSTTESYRRQLRLHIVPYIGRLKLAELQPAHVQKLRNDLSKAGVSTAMIKRTVFSLGALLACAMSNSKLSRNVVRDATSTRRQRRQQQLEERHAECLEVGIDIPSTDEMRRMIDAAESRWRPLVMAAILTGLRASELRGLTWNDIDFPSETLTVRQRADRWKAIGSPKSKTGKRSIPLAPLLVRTLKEWKLACPKGTLNLVFPNRHGGIEDLTTITRRGLGPLQYKLGITDVETIKAAHPGISERAAVALAKQRPKYGMHAFRHAAASLMINEGFDAKRIQVVLGHSTIRMTFDTYGHLFPPPAGDQEMMRRLQMRLVGER